MIQMSVFMLVLIYISGKIWVRCRERWEFHWPYRCFRCCIRSNDARDDNDDDVEADVLCYLCNKKVPSDEWNNSETGHRRYCAVRSKDNRGKITWCWKDIHICISLECVETIKIKWINSYKIDFEKKSKRAHINNKKDWWKINHFQTERLWVIMLDTVLILRSNGCANIYKIKIIIFIFMANIYHIMTSWLWDLLSHQ